MDQLQEAPRKDQHMKCLVCHHDMIERHVTLDLRYGGELVVIEEVPAIVCENCGE
jgi:YgiT-type zinc finger domain-containing protein